MVGHGLEGSGLPGLECMMTLRLYRNRSIRRPNKCYQVKYTPGTVWIALGIALNGDSTLFVWFIKMKKKIYPYKGLNIIS